MPDELIRWIGFYERLAKDPGMPRARADVEAMHHARDRLAKERGQRSAPP